MTLEILQKSDLLFGNERPPEWLRSKWLDRPLDRRLQAHCHKTKNCIHRRSYYFDRSAEEYIDQLMLKLI